MTTDKQIKRAARALVASSDAKSYQEALHRLDPQRGAKQLAAQADRVDLSRIARQLAAVWSQGKTVGPWPFDPYEQDPNYNQCNCGNRGDNYLDDEPECVCALGCSCPSCRHEQYRRAAICRLPAPTGDQPHAWCGQPTRYQVVPVCIHRDGVYREASPGDPDAESGSVHLGDHVQRDTTSPMYACSTQHARAMLEDRRARDARSTDDGRSTEWFYEVVSYRYAPDEFDVKTPLHLVAEHARSAQYWALEAIAAMHAGDTARARQETESALNYLAWAVGRAVQVGHDNLADDMRDVDDHRESLPNREPSDDLVDGEYPYPSEVYPAEYAEEPPR